MGEAVVSHSEPTLVRDEHHAEIGVDGRGVSYARPLREIAGAWSHTELTTGEDLPEARGFEAIQPERDDPAESDRSARLADTRLFGYLDTSRRVRVVIELDLPGCAVRDLRREHAAAGAFQAALGSCVDTNERESLAPFARWLEGRGATDVVLLGLNPSIAATVDGNTLRALTVSEQVARVHYDEREAGLLGYSGIEVRAALRTQTFIDAGLNGGSGGRAGGSQRLGVLELNDGTNFPNVAHAGFAVPVLGLSRFVANRDCRSGNCVNTSSTGIDNHGTRVARVLAGSIELGTDPNITDPFERTRRSGGAQLGTLYYYSVANTCSSWRAAVQRAVLDGIDVLNISAFITDSGTIGTAPCWTNGSCGGLSGDLFSAAEAGTLVVAGMGNDGDPGLNACNAKYPARHRDVFAVGGINTDFHTVNYDTSLIANASSRGGVDTRLWTGTMIQRAQAVADIATPMRYRYFYQSPPFGYDSANWSGTSLAAPAAAAALAMLRQQFASIGWPNSDARLLHVHGLLMGDSYHADLGFDEPRGLDRRSGSGRAHFHYPYSPSLVWPWGWGWHIFDIGPGQSVEFPIGGGGPLSSSIRQWKGAMLWREVYDASAPDIVFEVRDHCPSGGGGPVVIASDWSYDYHKRIELGQGLITNRCLHYRVRVLSMAGANTRRVYVAQYFHSGDPVNH
ncbi:MAG: S8 family serine peptidase [Sandaracinaceae bacterium]|nr:S8 family serine peptidase [Sandaracinaceae bacterium]